MRWFFLALVLVAATAVYDVINERMDREDARKLTEIESQQGVLRHELLTEADLGTREMHGLRIMTLEDARQAILDRHPAWSRN